MSGTHRFVAGLAALLLLTGLALGQVRSSAITGTVTDATGALVPGAEVVITNQETNVSAQVQSNAAGEYAVPYLAAGQYTVTVKAEGFQTFRKTDIIMGTGTTIRVDAALVTGSVATTIEVKANAVALQTESATVQAAVNQDIIQNIPNINNNPLYYATLQAGVVPSLQMYNGNVLGVGYAGRMQMSGVRINGGLSGSNDVQLDGISVQGAAWHETAVMPNRDAIQEVRVITNTFSADIGLGGGLISMISKAGTNQFHGSLNYRLRNEALNANGLSNNMYGIARSKYRVNEYGGTVGGPVIIPKLFNGRDKLLFFASFERLTHANPMNYQGRVPTDLERKGDFSATMVRDNNGRPIPVRVFDPFTALPYQGSNQVFIRQIYPGAVITNADPYGLKILQAYPLPNHPPTDAFQANNYFFQGSVPTVRNNLATRLDYRLGNRQSLYLSGGLQNGSVAAVNAWGDNKFGFYNNAGGQSTPISDDNPYVAVGDTITLTPTMIVDVRYGVTRVSTASGFPVTSGFNYSDFGMPANVQAQVAIPGTAPSIGNFGGLNTNGSGLSQLNFDGWNRKNEHQTNHALSGSVTKVLGKWTLKQGGEYRAYLGNWQDLQYATPSLGIWSNWNSTGQFGDINGNNSGSDFNSTNDLRGLDMAGPLVGAGGYLVAPGTSAKPALVAKYFALFSQNDWKVTPKLTLNLGLRWEVQPGPTERYNRDSALDLSVPNQYAQGLNLPGGPLAAMGRMAFAGRDGYSRNLWDTQWNNISARIGTAYRLGSSLVLRGGYGRTFTPSNTGFNANGLSYGMAPFANGTNPLPYGAFPNGVPVGRFENPQNTQIVIAKGAVDDPSLYGNVYKNVGTDHFPKQGFKNGQVDQWNLFVEQTFGKNWLASVGYVGSHASNLPWRWFPLNGLFNVPDSTLKGWRDQWVASNGTVNPATVKVPNPIPALINQATGPSGGGTIDTWRMGLPYMALLDETIQATIGTVNYNALQVRLEHAYANGLQMLLNYTWSKAVGLSGGSANSSYAESQIAVAGTNVTAPQGDNDYRNLQNNYGLMSYDTPQRFMGVVSYLLPTGRGQKLDPGNRFARALVGEWQFGTVVTLQSGQPWGNNCGGMNGRCNIAPGEPLELPKSLQRWYDGKTSVTLPNGRTITPAANRFLKWNPDYWTVPVVQFPNGKWAADQYQWLSTAHYLDNLRSPGLANVNLTVNRKFHLKEQAELQFLAEATNLFNRTNFTPGAVQAGYSAVTVADAATNTKVGQNASAGAGSLGMSFLSPRQITLSLRLQF